MYVAKRNDRRTRNVAAAFVALLLFHGIGFAQDDPKELFQIAAVPARANQPGALDDATVLRRQFVQLKYDPTVGRDASGRRGVAQRISLNLFPDLSVDAVLSSTVSYEKGALSWIGHLANDPESPVILVSVEGVMAGSIRKDGALYQLRYAGDGTHVVYEVDLSELPDEAEPIQVGGEDDDLALLGGGSELSLNADALGSEGDIVADEIAADDDGSLVDVAVHYTGAARVAAGGTAAIRALINLGITETNQAYADSGVVQRVNLVLTSEVTYAESGNMSTDLARLRATSDGFMDNVHSLRNTFGADLVHLITNSGGYCGIAYKMNTVSNAFATSAFGVTKRTCVSPNYSFAHEMGHNMGLGHDRYITTSNSPYPYCHGYVNQAALVGGAPANKRWRTIMAYNTECSDNGFGCTRLKRFSNPYLFNTGDRMGVLGSAASSSTDGPADARRCLNNTRSTVANFRGTVSVPARPTLISPSGLIPDLTPTFRWNAVSNATGYRLFVRRGSTNVTTHIVNYTSAQVGCSSGTGTCSATPPANLLKAAHTFWVRASNDVGNGPWSANMNFTVGMAQPTLLAPSGFSFDRTPTYRWTGVAGATWYRLWVNGPSGNVIQQWYSAGAVCSGLNCQVSPATTLGSGSHTFWVQGWAPGGFAHGPWSTSMSFSVLVLIPIPIPIPFP